jgi:S-ribosylhomocysteine lyase
MYISRQDKDITTYDIRMRRPNTEPVMDNDAMHTIEHLFATYVRNSQYEEHIVYFGPMGCRTGFYFLTRDMPCDKAVKLTLDAFEFIKAYTGEIPGTKPEECGNYRDHNLEKAKIECQDMVNILKDWDALKSIYPE